MNIPTKHVDNNGLVKTNFFVNKIVNIPAKTMNIPANYIDSKWIC